MPLRDHFRGPLDERRSWEELHGLWPGLIAVDLNRRLPPRYVAGPRVHLGNLMEIDVTTFETEDADPVEASEDVGGGWGCHGGLGTPAAFVRRRRRSA